MSGMRFLGLLKDGERPTASLEELARADGDRQKELPRSLLREVYGSIVDDLPRMTPKQLDDRLQELGTTQSTLRKARSFFVQAAKAAEIHVPESIAKGARKRGTPSARGGRKDRERPDNKTDKQASSPSPTYEKKTDEQTHVIGLRSGGQVALSLTINLFSLSAEDREFVLKLIDEMRTYENVAQK